MKQLFIVDTIRSYLYFKDGTSKVRKRELGCLGRYIYQYGDVPDDKTFEYTDWEAMLKVVGYVDDFKGSITKFRKRIYIDAWRYNLGKVYKDEFEKLVIETKYRIVQSDRYPSIEMLERDLGFHKYSELIFDRENELKKMMLHK